MSDATTENGDLLIERLNGPEAIHIETLEALSDIVLNSDESFSSFLSIRKLCLAVISILESTNSEQVLIADLQCLTSLLTSVFTIPLYLLQLGLLSKTNTLLSQTESVNVASLCFRILSFYSLDNPMVVGALVDTRHIQRFFPLLCPVDQRDVVTMFSRIAINCPSDSYPKLFPFVFMLAKHEDSRIRTLGSQIFLQISQKINPKHFPHEEFQKLISVLTDTTDFHLFTTVVQVLNRLINVIKIKHSPIERLPNFEEALFNRENNSENEKNILTVIQDLLPNPKLPSSIWSKKSSQLYLQTNLIPELENILMKYLIEKDENRLICLQNLAACSQVVPISPSFSFLNALLRAGRKSEYAPYFVVIAVNLHPKSFVIRSGLLPMIQKMQFPKNSRDWCKKKLSKLSKKCKQYERSVPNEILKSQSLEKIIAYIKREKIFPYEFMNYGLLGKCHELLSILFDYMNKNQLSDHSKFESISKVRLVTNDDNYKTSKNHKDNKVHKGNKKQKKKKNILSQKKDSNQDINSKLDLQTLIVLCNGVMDLIPFPKIQVISDFQFISHRQIKFVARGPNGLLGEINVPLLADFAMIEGWYNLKIRHHSLGALENAMSENSDLQFLFESDNDSNRSQTKFAFLNRAFKTPGYIKCSFEIEGCVYSAFDNVVTAISRNSRKISHLLQNKYDLQIKEEDAPRTDFKVRELGYLNMKEEDIDNNYLSERNSLDRNDFDMNSFDVMFRFLNLLFKMSSKEQFFINEQFTSSIFNDLIDPLQTMTVFSSASRLIFQEPFLFNFEQRCFLFRATALDSSSSAALIRDRFAPDQKKKDHIQHIRCTIRREKLFKDGCKVLKRIGAGSIRTDFVFRDENGIGEGPTQEFFALMSKEFCKRKTKLWRDNELIQGEFVYNEKGLFPSITAKPRLLKCLGYLCGKAILSKKIIDIPLNPAFFSLILGREVEVEDVDPVLAKSLKCEEGLFDLPFVYPGTSIPLKENGDEIDVNESNVKEYIKLVQDFTCGREMLKRLQPFIDAFQTNIHIGSLKLFDSEEIITLLCGDEVNITENELEKCVKLEHGYNENAEQIRFLFDIITKMNNKEQRLLIRFITGCSRLPYGGIASLKPPLTVAKRVDDTNVPDQCLPTVMTCTNYFKLPPYSSREIMKIKIEKAINECQDAFELS
ncbi:hypothetical protein TRFO_19139 [Tritrichomonas foetus]|uniref:HECT-type E3 ubiquitin transferase n=1 Tax=Tritrichomonas foetus TaxID=1144522 RepID=A0A1J4KJ87_9EUKA|nr:hypothetical protein TRFO_19139 [Tritrichomonas foetus]|eukprot:OHT11409.1 hypothetical protein TRFO_19139 [Tritrichomonas foetus]